LEIVHATYPDDKKISSYYKRYSDWSKACQDAVERNCYNVDIIKNTVILSYTTIGCDVRDVTDTDVKNDMLGMHTEAEKLRHSTLLDTLELCQSANDAGYYWSYVKPIVSDSCHEGDKPSPKKKKHK
jgi:hypothetical protein